MLIGLIPFSITQVYASAMRESGKTTLPMVAGMTAMVVNFIFNALLIFGLFGLPKLGVFGAAVATVISRFVELFIVLRGAHKKHGRYGFFEGLYTDFRIPGNLILPILTKSLPLLMNEFLWSLAQATLLQAYSVRGIAVIAAMNISGTISQIFNEVFLSLGNSAGILVGQELGADRLVSARRTAFRMATLTVGSTFVMGTLLSIAAPIIPQVYNTEPEIRALAAITFLFDSCFAWLVPVPAAYILSRYTALPALNVFMIVSLLEFIKCVIGLALVRSGLWVRNIVKNEQ